MDRLLVFTLVLGLAVVSSRDARAGARTYEVHLDRVTLTEAWGASGELIAPIHAIVAIRVLNGDTVIHERVLGRGPEDANRAEWSDPSLIGEGDGITGYLRVGEPRTIEPWKFLASDVVVPDGARLQIMVIVARATWFTEQPFQPSSFDRKAIAFFVGVTGAFFGGLGTAGGGEATLSVEGWAAGTATEALLGILIDALAPDTAVIPCWGLMRADVMQWDDAVLENTRVIVDDDGGFQWYGCPRPHIGYELSVRRTSFDDVAVTPGPCALVPLATADPSRIGAVWTDAVSSESSTFVVRLRRLLGSGTWPTLLRWAVEAVRRFDASSPLVQTHPSMLAVTTPVLPFLRDRRSDRWRISGPRPYAAACTHFVNVANSPTDSVPFPTVARFGPSDVVWDDIIEAMKDPQAITWGVGNGVTLQLYGESRDGVIVAYRVRYLRQAPDGAVLDDVMLKPGYDVPR
jgi:hypothetical protein